MPPKRTRKTPQPPLYLVEVEVREAKEQDRTEEPPVPAVQEQVEEPVIAVAAPEKAPKKKNAAYTLEEKMEDEMIEWVRDNEAVWRRGHRMYKQRAELWRSKSNEVGIPVERLEGWWRSMRDWYVRLTRTKSGDAIKKLTDREAWVLQRLSFYCRQMKASDGVSEPMGPLPRQPEAATDKDAEQPKIRRRHWRSSRRGLCVSLSMNSQPKAPGRGRPLVGRCLLRCNS